MRRFVFVARVLGMLVGFYVICAGLIAGLIGLDVVLFRAFGANRVTVVLLPLLTLAAILVVIRGVFVSTRLRGRDITGLEVRPADQPALWARVRQLAARVGTRAPRRLYLVPDVNAAVWENTRLLGLIPGRRQMMVGVPLLMALTPGQLDAVLAHELGHYGNRDTRLGALVGRTRQGVLAAVRAAGQRRRFQLPGSDLFLAIFGWYARVVLRFTQEASRAQELAADRVAAQIAGPDNATAALGALRGIDAAFDFYLNRYIAPGLRHGLLPPPAAFFGGFTELLAEPGRRAELDQIRQNPPAEKVDLFDSHPPMAERLAALATLPRQAAAPDPSGARAVTILANPADALAAVAVRSFAKQVAGKQVASWDDLARANGLRRADERAKPLREVVTRLTGRPADLPGLVALIDTGQLDAVLDALPRNEASRRAAATGREAREHAKTELAAMLDGWLVGHAARTGRAVWSHSWARVDGELTMAPRLRPDIDAAIDGLVAVRPDPTRLRAVVAGLLSGSPTAVTP